MKIKTTARANIALVKYWGKRDEKLNLPAAGSVSVTLRDLKTVTEMEFAGVTGEDTFLLNGNIPRPPELQKLSAYIDLFREISGINENIVMKSVNNFPTGAGLASSASGFAAIAAGASKLFGLDFGPREISLLARIGSGSAARSIYGGFAEMLTGPDPKGNDDYAVQLDDENHWPLEILVLITDPTRKKVSSREGMKLTASTSPFYKSWIDATKKDIEEIKPAIRTKNFTRLGEITEHNCLKLHALMMSANPGLIYWNKTTMEIVHTVRELRADGAEAYFTIDAGPQVKLLCKPGEGERFRKIFSDMPGISGIISTVPGTGVITEKGI